MKQFKYKIGANVTVTDLSKSDIKDLRNEKCIIEEHHHGCSYDYIISTNTNERIKVCEAEIKPYIGDDKMFKIDDKVHVKNLGKGTVISICNMEKELEIVLDNDGLPIICDFDEVTLIKNESDNKLNNKLINLICEEHDANNYIISKTVLHKLLENYS